MGIILALVYGGAILTGLVLSVAIRHQTRRHRIRVATAILLAPPLLLLTLGMIIKLIFFKEPPSLAELSQAFSSRHADLEEILRMSDQDVKFSRIAPTFLDRLPDEPNGQFRFMQGDPKADLLKTRWDQYRKIYAKNGITLGIQRNAAGDAFIMVDSVGLLNRGHVTGYVHCSSNPSTVANRFHPCLLHQSSATQAFDPDSGKEGFSFQKIDPRWFVYDEGPS